MTWKVKVKNDGAAGEEKPSNKMPMQFDYFD
jgi:hypothetical protein